MKLDNTYLLQYYNEIQQGKIIAGRELRKELRKLVEELENPLYRYDTKEANIRIAFMENLCLQSKKPFYMMPMKLLLWQKAFIEVLYSYQKYSDELGRYIRRFQDVMLLIARKNGKALDINTRIPTPQGDKKMIDIEEGDYVFGIDGKSVRVLKTSEIFYGHKCFEVVFEDGERIVADAEHLWQVRTKDGHECVIATEKMQGDYYKKRSDGKGIEYKYRVPLSKLEENLNKGMLSKSIVKIQEVQSVPTKCLYVEGGLYLCGEKNTVTHNTTLMAADAHTDLRIGDGGQDIVCASNDDKQASLLWNEVDGMRKRIDSKGKWTHKNMSLIMNLGNDTKIFKLSSKTQNKDGRNIDKTYFDESHDAEDDEIAAACQKSMSIKDEPLFINLTTEGFVNDGYLDNKLVYARKVLNDEIDDDTFLPWLYTQDSENEIWQDETSWYKSNPSLGAIKKWSYLRGEVAKSRVDKSVRMHTLCKDFNIKQNNAQAWLMTEDYDYPTEVFTLEEFRGAICLGAVDLAATTDLASAKILLMKPNDRTKYIYSHYWIPESKLENSDDKEAGANYVEWARQGLMTIHEGNEVEISKIADWFYSLYKDYDIKTYKCGYDQRYAKTFLDKMDEYGFECEMIYQNRHVMSSPMKLVEAELKARLINYNQHKVDKWCLGNSSMEMDNLGNVMCVKVNNQPGRRIDGAVTFIILYEVYRRFRSDFTRMVK